MARQQQQQQQQMGGGAGNQNKDNDSNRIVSENDPSKGVSPHARQNFLNMRPTTSEEQKQ